MRSLGAAAVFGACLSMSLSAVRAVKNRIRCLFWLCQAVESIRAELATRLTPLPELLRLAAERTEGECKSFFSALVRDIEEPDEHSLPELWTIEADKRLPSLPEESRRELQRLGLSLGRYELQEQLAACERFLSALDAAHGEERGRFAEKRRVLLALGTAAGALLCLVFL